MIYVWKYYNIYRNIIWFECKKENLIISVESDFRPIVGDSVLLKGKNYNVYEVKWVLEQKPAQCCVIVYIE